jgi:sugar phosphate isomerase/epimerase
MIQDTYPAVIPITKCERRLAAMKNLPVAYQLYSAREEAQKDLNALMIKLKKLGYDGVEFAGFYGHSAAEIKSMLSNTGLIGISSHVTVKSISVDMAGTIAFHKAIGSSYIAIPYLEDAMRPGKAGFAGLIRLIYQFGSLCRQAGIQLIYHNHDFEFVTVSELYGLDFIYAAIPEALLKTEIDVCWVKYSGVNPAEYIRKYSGRCAIVHLKDYVGIRGGASPYTLIGQEENKPADNIPFMFMPFGHGCQDARAIVEAGIEAGAEWFVVEQDLSAERTPLEDAALSLETLREIGVKR